MVRVALALTIMMKLREGWHTNLSLAAKLKFKTKLLYIPNSTSFSQLVNSLPKQGTNFISWVHRPVNCKYEQTSPVILHCSETFTNFQTKFGQIWRKLWQFANFVLRRRETSEKTRGVGTGLSQTNQTCLPSLVTDAVHTPRVQTIFWGRRLQRSFWVWGRQRNLGTQTRQEG